MGRDSLSGSVATGAMLLNHLKFFVFLSLCPDRVSQEEVKKWAESLENLIHHDSK